jgi:hypothetical protein
MSIGFSFPALPCATTIDFPTWSPCSAGGLRASSMHRTRRASWVGCFAEIYSGGGSQQRCWGTAGLDQLAATRCTEPRTHLKYSALASSMSHERWVKEECKGTTQLTTDAAVALAPPSTLWTSRQCCPNGTWTAEGECNVVGQVLRLRGRHLLTLPAVILAAMLAFGARGQHPEMVSISSPFRQSISRICRQPRDCSQPNTSPIVYRRYGPNDAGDVVVAIHGSSASSNSLHPLAKVLASAGF